MTFSSPNPDDVPIEAAPGQPIRIQGPFRIGLLGGLGVLLAIAIGAAVLQLATVLTYVFAAIFLALGLDPIIRLLVRRRVPRGLALVIVLVLVTGALVGIVFAIVPALVGQTTELVKSIAKFSAGVTWQQFVKNVESALGNTVDLNTLITQTTTYLQKNAGTIGGGVLQVGIGIAGGVAGVIVVFILTLYFAGSLETFKRALYAVVPASKRSGFAEIAEQIFQSVGKYVIGQVSLALVNGVLSFIFLSIIGAQLPIVFAFIAFLGSLIPLVGTISAAVLIFLGQLALDPTHPPTWIWTGIYYLVYMQFEAYFLNPNIMNRAVKVPGVVVVIAALAGGTLLGILGALVAIPVAASILLIVEQVVVPKQDRL